MTGYDIGRDLRESDKRKKQIAEVIELCQRDAEDNSLFYERLEYLADIRYSRVDRDVTMPWDGASNLHLPLSDVYSTQLAPAYMNILFGGDRTIAVDPIDSGSVVAAQNAELVANECLERMPEFKENVAYFVNSILTWGKGIMRTTHCRRSEVRDMVIDASRLPGRLSIMSFQPGASEEDVAMGTQVISQSMPASAQENFEFFREPVLVVNRRLFAKHRAKIAMLVSLTFDFDPKDERDLIDDVMSWLSKGMPDGHLVVQVEQEVYDGPLIEAMPPNELIVPVGTCDFRNARRLTERLFMTKEELQMKADEDEWPKDVVGRILKEEPRSQRSLSDRLEEQLQMRSAMPSGKTQTYEIWRVYSYADLTGKGRPERVVTTLHAETMSVLKDRPFPYAHGEWPFVWVGFEAHAPQYHAARGVVEILQDVEAHARAGGRHMENAMTLTCTPTFIYDRNAFTGIDELEYLPGRGFPVNNPQRDIIPFTIPTPLAPLQYMQQFLMMWPERLIGGLDNQQLADSKLLEPRTATEIGTMESARQRVLSMRGMLFLSGWKKIFRQMWALYRQYGPDSIWVRMLGEQPKILSQTDIGGNHDIRPSGAVGSMDPSVRSQKMLTIHQLTMQMLPILQSDVRYEVDPVSTFVNAINTLDPLAGRIAIKRRTPQQIAEALQAQQQMAVQGAQQASSANNIQNNVPVDQAELVDTLTEARSMSPHKGLQKVKERGEQAVSTFQRNRALVNR